MYYKGENNQFSAEKSTIINMNEQDQLLKESTFAYIQSSGPGGQNVNKVATAVQLRFDIKNTSLLDEEIKARLLKIAGKRVTSEGTLVIEAKRYRSQEKNKADAMRRMFALVEKAETPPQVRKPSSPNSTAKIKRVEAKKRRGEIKQNRKTPVNWD
jgi:ribosome-associated protein